MLIRFKVFKISKITCNALCKKVSWGIPELCYMSMPGGRMVRAWGRLHSVGAYMSFRDIYAPVECVQNPIQPNVHEMPEFMADRKR